MAKRGTWHLQRKKAGQHGEVRKRKTPSRTRTYPPLHVRLWVADEPTAEKTCVELTRRINALESAGEPFARDLLALVQSMLQEVATMFGQLDARLDLPHGATRSLARLIGANLVATYWQEHAYKPGIFLPLIVTIGAPWDTPPDAIHILDLSRDAVRQALSGLSSLGKRKTAASLRSARTPGDLFQIQVETALATIRQMGPAAVLDRWVLVTLFICLTHAKFNVSKAGAKRAAEDALRLLDAFRPDLSARMTRIPERLADLQTRFGHLHAGAATLLKALGTFGPTNPTLAKARDLFGGWVDRPDLNRWQRMTSYAIALEIIGRERGLTRKALRDQLWLADKAKDIEVAWREVQAHLLTRPEQTRHRIALFPSEPGIGGE